MRRKTNEEFVREVDELVGSEYTILEEYTLSSKPTKMRHNVCGHEYSPRPNSFLKGGRCPNCNGNDAKNKTTEQFKKEVFDLVGDEYTVLGEYKNRVIDIEIRHNKCGREYLVRPHNFLSRSRCIECYHDTLRLSQDEATSKLHSSLDSTYKIVSEYESLQRKTKVKHEVCGNTYEVRLSDVIQKKSSCPYCKQSVGEQQVATYLRSNGIEFTINKKFDDLKDQFQLSYDFHLPKHNTLIEFQGEQHFIPKTFGGITKKEAKEKLELQKYHDKLKREYANNNGFILLEPSYKLNTFEKVVKFLDTHLHC